MRTKVDIINDSLSVNAKVGSTLQEVLEFVGSGLPFGCKDGQCGTCIVEVVQGSEFLSPRTEKEKNVLKNVGESKPHARLACQMHILSENGHIKLKY